ncbi:MAG: ribbon-helix-helix protein, CopG family [Gaiella sp.]|nr:ribbon-helix-helix protein, CopG family [Gaiella sp.]
MKQNVTLALPSETIRRLKVLAAERGSSISRMLTEQLEELLDRESGYERARKRALARLERGCDLGTGGKATWTRDELHER